MSVSIPTNKPDGVDAEGTPWFAFAPRDRNFKNQR